MECKSSNASIRIRVCLKGPGGCGGIGVGAHLWSLGQVRRRPRRQIPPQQYRGPCAPKARGALSPQAQRPLRAQGRAQSLQVAGQEGPAPRPTSAASVGSPAAL